MGKTNALQNSFKMIRKHIGLIILMTIMSIVISGFISLFVLSPVYQSSTEILVNQSTADADQFINQNIQTDLQLINTYSGIIKSPAILDQVIKEINLNLTTDELIKKITVSNAEQSQIIEITVLDQDPAMAVVIANTTANIFEKEILELMNIDNVKIFSPAVMKENPVPVSPEPVLNITIAGVIGLMVGVGTASLMEYLDTTMKDQEDIESILGIPFLGIISPIVEKAEFVPISKSSTNSKEGRIDDEKDISSSEESR